jgi:hypothetical protein
MSTYTVTLKARTAITGRARKPLNRAATRMLLTDQGVLPGSADAALDQLASGDDVTLSTRYGFANVHAN